MTASGSGVFTTQSSGSDDGLSSTEAGSTAGDGSTSADGSSGGTGPLLDIGASDTGTAEAGGEGCKAVDFLFVIDNSGSMGDNQEALVQSFQPFMDAILETVDAGDDYHIMVTKTDAGWIPFECTLGFCLLTCPDLPAGLCENPVAPSMCDERLGSGVTYPLGDDSSNQQCNLAGGNRYILSTEPDLGAAFSCIAQVGTDGDSDEQPMASLTNALSGELLNPGGCNEGFLRDDAILVVTLITDEEDDSSPGTPAGWYQNLLSAKSNDPNAFVMLGLINDTDAPTPICPVESQDPVKLREFVSTFPNHVFGSVCDTDGYGDFFAQAVDLIDTTCDDFIPPG